MNKQHSSEACRSMAWVPRKRLHRIYNHSFDPVKPPSSLDVPFKVLFFYR